MAGMLAADGKVYHGETIEIKDGKVIVDGKIVGDAPTKGIVITGEGSLKLGGNASISQSKG